MLKKCKAWEPWQQSLKQLTTSKTLKLADKMYLNEQKYNLDIEIFY